MSTVDPAPFLDPSPPPWAARSLGWVLLALFVVTAVALVLVQVPEAVAARFVLVPVRGTDPVRTLHNGIVTAVRVSDADSVEAGAVLFTVDSEFVGDRTAERDSLGTSLSGGQRRLSNERDKFENQRRADEQEVERLQQRVVALESVATTTAPAEMRRPLSKTAQNRPPSCRSRDTTRRGIRKRAPNFMA